MSLKNFAEWQNALKQHEKKLQLVAGEAAYHAAIKARDRVYDRLPPGIASVQGMTNEFPGYAARGRMKTTFAAYAPTRQGNTARSRMALSQNANRLDRQKAYVHEYGWIIRPRRAKYLVFKIFDKWVSVKRAVIREKRYFRSAWAETLRAGRADIERYIREHWRP